MVYVDTLRRYPASSFNSAVPEHWCHISWCHLWADTLTELHEMARVIGLKRQWFQDGTSGPHYDLTARMRSRAVNAGAIER